MLAFHDLFPSNVNVTRMITQRSTHVSVSTFSRINGLKIYNPETMPEKEPIRNDLDIANRRIPVAEATKYGNTRRHIMRRSLM